jgi:hypothetical protein
MCLEKDLLSDGNNQLRDEIFDPSITYYFAHVLTKIQCKILLENCIGTRRSRAAFGASLWTGRLEYDFDVRLWG